METIFDHNITPEEMRKVFGLTPEWWPRVKVLAMGFSQRDHYEMLYRLYRYRGDVDTAMKYADKIPDDIHKVFGLCYHDFAID